MTIVSQGVSSRSAEMLVEDAEIAKLIAKVREYNDGMRMTHSSPELQQLVMAQIMEKRLAARERIATTLKARHIDLTYSQALREIALGATRLFQRAEEEVAVQASPVLSGSLIPIVATHAARIASQPDSYHQGIGANAALAEAEHFVNTDPSFSIMSSSFVHGLHQAAGHLGEMWLGSLSK